MSLYSNKPGPNWIITVEGIGQFGTSHISKRDWNRLHALGATIEYRPVCLSVAEICKVIKSRRFAKEREDMLF